MRKQKEGSKNGSRACALCVHVVFRVACWTLLLTCLFLYFAKDSKERWFHSMTVERMFSVDDDDGVCVGERWEKTG